MQTRWRGFYVSDWSHCSRQSNCFFQVFSHLADRNFIIRKVTQALVTVTSFSICNLKVFSLWFSFKSLLLSILLETLPGPGSSLRWAFSWVSRICKIKSMSSTMKRFFSDRHLQRCKKHQTLLMCWFFGPNSTLFANLGIVYKQQSNIFDLHRLELRRELGLKSRWQNLYH